MKQLLLGNEAVACGCTLSGVRSFQLSRYAQYRKLRKQPQNLKKYIVNGLPMKKSQPKLLQVHPLPVLVLFVL